MNRRLLSNDKYGQTIKKILILCMVMVVLGFMMGCGGGDIRWGEEEELKPSDTITKVISEDIIYHFSRHLDERDVEMVFVEGPYAGYTYVENVHSDDWCIAAENYEYYHSKAFKYFEEHNCKIRTVKNGTVFELFGYGYKLPKDYEFGFVFVTGVTLGNDFLPPYFADITQIGRDVMIDDNGRWSISMERCETLDIWFSPEVTSVPYNGPKGPIDTNDVYIIPDVNPEFPGGKDAMFAFLQENIRYPKEARDAKVEGKVLVRFIVERDGSISQLEVKRDIGYGCGEEALRVMRKMPKWKPGKVRDTAVRCQFFVPVKFNQ